MCGFVGVIRQEEKLGPDEFTRMLNNMAERIKHRGPDDSGIWLDLGAGIGLAHRRLAVIDLSEAGHQPMISPGGRFVIVYNGEIYNFQELRRDLEEAGFRKWKGHSDTEVIVAAIEQWGVRGTLHRLVGMFAFALWDRQERSLYLARDRMGEKPLYYGYVNKTLFFGSDLAAFWGSYYWKPEIDPNALGLYMKYGYVPAPFSIFKNVYKLIPGTFLELDQNDLAKLYNGFPIPDPYWSLIEVIDKGTKYQFSSDSAEAVEELERLLERSVLMQKVADVPVGTFLSGGIDSSLVTAILQTNSSRPVKTFSIGFTEKSYNEAQYARRVASYLKTDHTELYVTPEDAMQTIPDIPVIYSEPFADVSQLPTVLLSRLARQQVTVCLSGDGGDELFFGYTRYVRDPARWRKIDLLPKFLRSFLSFAIEKTPHTLLDLLLFWGKRYRTEDMHQGSLSSSVKKLGKELRLADFHQLYDFRMSQWWEPGAIVPEYDDKSFLPPSSSGQDDILMMLIDSLMYLPDDILVKVDRAAMSTSLETRIPLLDHRIVEFAMHLPNCLKMKNSTQKWPLRRLLYKYVPSALAERHKMGFGVPVGAWLRGPLREWAEELLDERALKYHGYLSSDPIRRMWFEHQAGRFNRQGPLWNVLMFQTWYQKYFGGAI